MKTVAATACALALLGLAGCGSGESPPDITLPTTVLVSAPPNGLVRGRLIEAGGPAPGTAHPIAGTLTFTGPDGSVATTDVNETGRYAIELTPGEYRISGRPLNSGTKDWCYPTKPVTTITADGDTVADIYCSVP